MKLSVNGEDTDLTVDSDRLSDVLTALQIEAARGVAVAVNYRVIPRSQWQEFVLHDGDALEIIRATQGG